MIADINEDAGKRAAEAKPDSMKFHKTNVTQERDWRTLLEATQDAFGGLDCLVNNAGTTYKNKVSSVPTDHGSSQEKKLRCFAAANIGGDGSRFRSMFQRQCKRCLLWHINDVTRHGGSRTRWICHQCRLRWCYSTASRSCVVQQLQGCNLERESLQVWTRGSKNKIQTLAEVLNRLPKASLLNLGLTRSESTPYALSLAVLDCESHDRKENACWLC